MSTFRELISCMRGGGTSADDTRTKNSKNVIPPESPLVAASPHWSITINQGTMSATTTTDAQQHYVPTFTPFIAFCFTLNYVVGTGFLTIPWAFEQSGIVLSAVVMILSAILSDIAKDYLLETMARAEVMLDHNMHWIKNTATNKIKTMEQYQKMKSFSPIPPITTIEEIDHNAVTNEKNPLLTTDHRVNSSNALASLPNYKSSSSFDTSKVAKEMAVTPPSTPNARKNFYQRQAMKQRQERYMVGHQRKFEVNALCRIFLGKNGLQFYTIVLCLYMCGTLCAYTNVFASAMSEAVPIIPHHDNYLYYVGIYSLVVVPMSCMELHEQITVQVGMTICRFIMLILMITTSFHCASIMHENRNDHDELYLTPPSMNVNGLYKTVPILVMANIYHHSIPGLAQPVIDKTKLGNVIFRSTTICTAVAYTLLGIVLGYAFKASIAQSANLNWKYCYNRHTQVVAEDGSTIEMITTLWYMKGISYFIILFPVLDVLSAFPLNAITLGNNMFGAYYGNRIHEVENNRLLRTIFRLLASIPPLIIGVFVRELGLITDYTGTIGFILGLTIPGLLYTSSTKMAKRKNFVSWTYYTSYGCNGTLATLVTWFGAMMVIIVIISLLLAG